MPDPLRGEVWLADLGDPIGHEAGNARPCVIVSDDRANSFGLAMICPITRSRLGYSTHVEVEPTRTNLDVTSYVQTEQLRTISTLRLTHRVGTIDGVDLARVERSLRFLLRL
ncbi:MAG: type II toxin-antitoxin system PemK/MazF family toxin [Sporichthyaceae bacterium]